MNKTAVSNTGLKVFVSYSRVDLAFADQLVAILELQDFQPIIDRKGIHGAENWKARLGQLILESDIIVFILSPDSVKSDVCDWEVDEAIRRGKRIVPVLCRPLSGATPHSRLRDLNYIHFYEERDLPGSGFGTGSARLVDALVVDVAWLREHSRLEELASRWEDNGRPEDLLVRGSELGDYERWRNNRPANVPNLTDLQRLFLGASEEAEAARQNAERKRLSEITDAQKAREEALRKAEHAQTARARYLRRTYFALTTLTAILVVGGPPIYEAIVSQRVIASEAARTDITGQILAFSDVSGGSGLDATSDVSTSPYTTDLLHALRDRRSSVLSALLTVNKRIIQRDRSSNVPFISTNMNGSLFLWDQPESRQVTAFVFGAWDYPARIGPLRGPRHDIRSVASLLEETSLERINVVEVGNATKARIVSSIESKIVELSLKQPEIESKKKGLLPVREVKSNHLAIFYWSGHAFNIDGSDYLLPIPKGDISLEGETLLREGLALGRVRKLLENFAASIVILDASRTNPFPIGQK